MKIITEVYLWSNAIAASLTATFFRAQVTSFFLEYLSKVMCLSRTLRNIRPRLAFILSYVILFLHP